MYVDYRLPKPNFKLLKEVYAIIDGIPKERFDLDQVAVAKETASLTSEPMRAECGSVACAIGWMAMHPKFNAKGLWISIGGTLFLHDKPVEFDNAAAEIFGLSWQDAYDLFTVAEQSELDRFKNNHKRVWKHRVREFLIQHGQLKPGR